MSAVLGLPSVYSEALALAIEYKAFVHNRTVKRFNREIEKGAPFNCGLGNSTESFLESERVCKMVLNFIEPVVNCNEYIIAFDETSAYQWLPEASDGLARIVYIQKFVEVNLIQLSASVVNDFEPKLAVVLVSYVIYGSILVLLNLIHLNVSSNKSGLKLAFMGVQVVALDLKVLIFIIYNGDAMFGVVGDDDLNNIIFRFYICSQGQVLKHFLVPTILKLLKNLNLCLVGCFRF